MDVGFELGLGTRRNWIEGPRMEWRYLQRIHRDWVERAARVDKPIYVAYHRWHTRRGMCHEQGMGWIAKRVVRLYADRKKRDNGLGTSHGSIGGTFSGGRKRSEPATVQNDARGLMEGEKWVECRRSQKPNFLKDGSESGGETGP